MTDFFFEQYTRQLIEYSNSKKEPFDFIKEIESLFKTDLISQRQPQTEEQFQEYINGVLRIISELVNLNGNILNEQTVEPQNKLARLYLRLIQKNSDAKINLMGNAYYEGVEKVNYQYPKFTWQPQMVVFKKQLYQSIVHTINQDRIDQNGGLGTTTISNIFKAGLKINSKLEINDDFLLAEIRFLHGQTSSREVSQWRPVTDLIERFYLAIVFASYEFQNLMLVNTGQAETGAILSPLYIEMMLFSIFDQQAEYIGYRRSGDTFIVDMFASMPSYLYVRSRLKRSLVYRKQSHGWFFDRALRYFIIIQMMALASNSRYVDQSITFAERYLVAKSQAMFETILLIVIGSKNTDFPEQAKAFMDISLISMKKIFDIQNQFYTLGYLQLEEYSIYQLEEMKRIQYFYKLKEQFEFNRVPDQTKLQNIQEMEQAVIYFQEGIKTGTINKLESIFFMDNITFFRTFTQLTGKEGEEYRRYIYQAREDEQKMVYSLTYLAIFILLTGAYPHKVNPPFAEQSYFGNQSFKRSVLFFNKKDKKFYRNFDNFKSFEASIKDLKSQGQLQFEKNQFSERDFMEFEEGGEQDVTKRIDNQFMLDENEDKNKQPYKEDYVETYSSVRVDPEDDKEKVNDVFEDIQNYYNFLKYIWINKYEYARRQYANDQRSQGKNNSQLPILEQFKQLKGLQSIAILASLNFYYVEVDDLEEVHRIQIMQLVAEADANLGTLITQALQEVQKQQENAKSKVEVVEGLPLPQDEPESKLPVPDDAEKPKTIKMKSGEELAKVIKKTAQKARILDMSNIQIVENYLLGFRDFDIYQQIQKNLFYTVFTQLYAVSEGNENVVDMQMIKHFMESSFDRLRTWRIYIQPFMEKLFVQTIVSHSINILVVFRQLQVQKDDTNYKYFKDFPLTAAGVDQQFLGIVKKSAAQKLAERSKIALDWNGKGEKINLEIIEIEKLLGEYRSDIFKLKNEIFTKEELLLKRDQQLELLEQKTQEQPYTRSMAEKIKVFTDQKNEMERKAEQLSVLLEEKKKEVEFFQQYKTNLANLVFKNNLLNKDLQGLIKSITIWYGAMKGAKRQERSSQYYHETIQGYIQKLAEIKKKQIGLGFSNKTIASITNQSEQLKNELSRKTETLWTVKIAKQFAQSTINNLKVNVNYNDRTANPQKVLQNKIAAKINKRQYQVEEYFNGQVSELGGSIPNFNRYESKAYQIYKKAMIDNPQLAGPMPEISTQEIQRIEQQQQRYEQDMYQRQLVHRYNMEEQKKKAVPQRVASQVASDNYYSQTNINQRAAQKQIDQNMFFKLRDQN